MPSVNLLRQQQQHTGGSGYHKKKQHLLPKYAKELQVLNLKGKSIKFFIPQQLYYVKRLLPHTKYKFKYYNNSTASKLENSITTATNSNFSLFVSNNIVYGNAAHLIKNHLLTISKKLNNKQLPAGTIKTRKQSFVKKLICSRRFDSPQISDYKHALSIYSRSLDFIKNFFKKKSFRHKHNLGVNFLGKASILFNKNDFSSNRSSSRCTRNYGCYWQQLNPKFNKKFKFITPNLDNLIRIPANNTKKQSPLFNNR